jgi:hypothetical protein
VTSTLAQAAGSILPRDRFPVSYETLETTRGDGVLTDAVAADRLNALNTKMLEEPTPSADRRGRRRAR